MVRVSDLYNYSMKELKPESYRGSEPYKHFTTVFTMHKKRLIFVGGPHISGSSKYTRFIVRLLALEKPGIVLVERQCDLTEAQLRAHSMHAPKTSWRESDWAIDFAARHSIDFAGMDISDAEILRPFTAMPRDGMELGIAFWTLLNYYSHKRHMPGTDSASALAIVEARTVLNFLDQGMPPLHRLKGRFLTACRKHGAAGIAEAVDKIVRYVVGKYVGKGPLLELIDSSNLTAPYPFAKDCELSRISAKWHAYRDKAMIDNCVSALRKQDKVVAIAGAGHIMEMRGVLEHELKARFGEVVSRRWDELHR